MYFLFLLFSQPLSPYPSFFSLCGFLVNCKALYLSGKLKTSFPAREPSGKENNPKVVFHFPSFQPAPHPYIFSFIYSTHTYCRIPCLIHPALGLRKLKMYQRVSEGTHNGGKHKVTNKANDLFSKIYLCSK